MAGMRALVRACVRMLEPKSMPTDARNNTYLAGDAMIRHMSVFGARDGRGRGSDIPLQAYENRNVAAWGCNHGIGPCHPKVATATLAPAATPLPPPPGHSQ